MNEEMFIKIMENIKEKFSIDRERATKLSEIFPNCFEANFLPDKDLIFDSLISLLEEILNDKETKWIQYYIYELNFGEENYRMKVQQDGKEIPLTTPSDLYRILTKH